MKKINENLGLGIGKRRLKPLQTRNGERASVAAGARLTREVCGRGGVPVDWLPLPACWIRDELVGIKVPETGSEEDLSSDTRILQ